MFERYTWVCSTFEVLRRPSARRHNDNLHFAQSGIFRPAEYLIARSNGNIPPTINPFLLRSNNKDARKTNNNPFAPAYSHENHNKNNDDKFGLEKMFIGDNTKSGAALTTVASNPRLLRC
jgi:hypothetical protein